MTDTAVEVARVGSDDLDDLLPLMQAYCAFYETAPTDLRSVSLALLADPDGEGVQLIARDEAGAALGFATLYWSWDTTVAMRVAIMHDLFVVPHARSRRVGHALIEACADEARRHGKARLDWTTATDNATAQRLYDRTGAARSTWVHYDLDLA